MQKTSQFIKVLAVLAGLWVKEARYDAADGFLEDAGERDKRRWDRLREYAGAVSPTVIRSELEIIR